MTEERLGMMCPLTAGFPDSSAASNILLAPVFVSFKEHLYIIRKDVRLYGEFVVYLPLIVAVKIE